MSHSPTSIPPRAVVVRHVAFEDLGSFAGPLAEGGWRVQYVEAGLDGLDAAADADLLVVLGGPIGAGDDGPYPFLTEEVRLIEGRLAADRPTLGICLGAQLMARALGARVYGAGRKEIGWGPLSLSEAGAASALSLLAPDRASVLHWHGDTFDLPHGAIHLAATEVCENQAFGWGERALALQFHPEVTAAGLERWFIGHTLEIATTPDISVAQLRDATRRFAPALERQGPAFLRRWLGRVL
ncbi:MAG: glutamine amidotransferase [Deltaproteobacteria bacterium]|nr:glutamine amidotransferase [Deltaproteobacteria bacterium]